MEDEKEAKFVYQLFECSPKAMKLIDPDSVGVGEPSPLSPNAKYPFASMKIGQSFMVTFGELEVGTLQSLRSAASRESKKRIRKYVVIVHNELDCVEVARIN